MEPTEQSDDFPCWYRVRRYVFLVTLGGSCLVLSVIMAGLIATEDGGAVFGLAV